MLIGVISDTHIPERAQNILKLFLISLRMLILFYMQETLYHYLLKSS